MLYVAVHLINQCHAISVCRMLYPCTGNRQSRVRGVVKLLGYSCCISVGNGIVGDCDSDADQSGGYELRNLRLDSVIHCMSSQTAQVLTGGQRGADDVLLGPSKY